MCIYVYECDVIANMLIYNGDRRVDGREWRVSY